MAIDRTFGVSTEVESSAEETLSQTHADFLLAFLEEEQLEKPLLSKRFFRKKDSSPKPRMASGGEPRYGVQ
jgi:hypothetical protein